MITDKRYTFSGHYTLQYLETGRVRKAFQHEMCQYEPVEIATLPLVLPILHFSQVI